MKRATTVIIGAGQSGLAMSHELTKRSVDHVVLERGQVANSWRTERWDSLRMLSPNWANGLPGTPYQGSDPHGFMPVRDLIRNFDTCAQRINAPVQTETNVVSVDACAGGYTVQTDQGAFSCRAVVMTNGACAEPQVPAFAADLPESILQFTPMTYKRPSDLPQGPVLVVGASASGMQLARDIQQSGRRVILAVSNHLRLPRTYREIDTFAWLDKLGLSSVPYTEVDDIERVRRTPSLTLHSEGTLDLNSLQDLGVEIVGRMAAIRDDVACFSGGLANLCAAADLKMNRFLDAIDEWVFENRAGSYLPPAERYAPTRVSASPRLQLNLKKEGIGAVVWATGYSPDFSWLNLPVFDRKGRLNHDGGLVAPGLYAMGLPYLRQRKSTFISGAEKDASALAAHLFNQLDQRSAA